MEQSIFSYGAKNIHFIGVGGISMSALAEILQRRGHHVSGSDDIDSGVLDRLRGLGVKVFVPNAACNISDKTELVVYTAAVKADNPEFVAAKEMGIPLMERAALIGKMLPGYPENCCVSGTHGKTTTTSLVSDIFLEAELDPTILIGGHMNRDGMNYRVGESPYLVLEACEYNNSYHHWHPKIGVILNIDSDHLDFFGSLDGVTESFAKFANNISPDGYLVINRDVPGYESLTANLPCKVVSFGTDSATARFWADDVEFDEGFPSFTIMDGDSNLAWVKLSLPGSYNMMNALAAFSAAYVMGVPARSIEAALCKSKGVKRRFEYKGMVNGAKIFDDYAHHPTEIRSCLRAAKARAEGGRLICLFQPHTYSRTKALLQDFAESFEDADHVSVLPIYPAREPFDASISSEMLVEGISKSGIEAAVCKTFDEAVSFFLESLRPGDLFLTMGAGDAFKVGDKMATP